MITLTSKCINTLDISLSDKFCPICTEKLPEIKWFCQKCNDSIETAYGIGHVILGDHAKYIHTNGIEYTIKNWRTFPGVGDRLKQISRDRQECIMCKGPGEDHGGGYYWCKTCGGISYMIFNIVVGEKERSDNGNFDSSNWFNYTNSRYTACTISSIPKYFSKQGIQIINYSVIPDRWGGRKATLSIQPQCNLCKHWCFLGPYCYRGCAGPSSCCFDPA